MMMFSNTKVCVAFFHKINGSYEDNKCDFKNINKLVFNTLVALGIAAASHTMGVDIANSPNRNPAMRI